MSYNAVMVDLETLGNGSDAAIVAIGAVRFHTQQPCTMFTSDQLFYRVVSLESSTKAGGKIDASTVLWWVKQSEDARRIFNQEGVELKDALQDFYEFVPTKETFLFGCGATFDNMILRHAYKCVGLTYPVTFRHDVCYRTLRYLVDFKAPNVGVLHNALDDAKSQTLHLFQILKEVHWNSK